MHIIYIYICIRVKAYDRTSHQPPRMIPDLKSIGSASWQVFVVLVFFGGTL